MLNTETINILHTFTCATDAQYDAGINWYPAARDHAASLSSDVWRAAGVLSAYSPLTPWWRNLELATDSLTSGVARTDTLGNNHRAAARILAGEDPRDVFKAPKTRSFVENIATAGTTDAVTVDSHAFSIAMGRHFFSKEPKLGIRRYREIAQAYRIAAGMVNLRPSEIQAITWVVWRDLNPNKAARKGGV